MKKIALTITSVFTALTEYAIKPFPYDETKNMFMFFTGKVNEATFDIGSLNAKCGEEILKKNPDLKKIKETYLPIFLEKTKNVTSKKKLQRICDEFILKLETDFGKTIEFAK